LTTTLAETCKDIAYYDEIEMSDLLAWNSWLDPSNCTSSLFAGLNKSSAARDVCLGLNTTSADPDPILTSTTSAITSPT
jgi:hypothetical protein